MSSPNQKSRNRRAVGIRLVVTATAVALIAGAVLVLGGLGERRTRALLTQELETRLLAETRDLSLLSTSALLSDFPELTLHPLLKEMSNERPALAQAVVVDLDGIIQGHPNAEKLGTPYTPDPTLHPAETKIALNRGEVMLANATLLVARSPIRHPNGETIGTAMVSVDWSHIETALAEARHTQRVLLATTLALAVLITLLVMSLLLRPISVLRSGIERIGAGDFDFRLDISSRTELGVLANTVNEMAAHLKSARRDLIEKERLSHEMELAREIQRSLLPDGSLAVHDFTIAGIHHTADEVGGDYFNAFPLDADRVAIMVADVAGKGLGGCLVTSMIDVLARTLSPSYASPSSLMVAMEKSLKDSLRPGTFITMFYAVLDGATGRMTFASAAHNPLLRYVASSGTLESIPTEGVPIGLLPDGALARTLVDRTIDVEPGDLLVVFTDGLSEAVDADGEEYGYARLEDLVRDNGPGGGDAVTRALEGAISDWEGGLPASDDKTLLTVTRSGTPSAVRRGDAAAKHVLPQYVNRLWSEHAAHSQHYSMPATLESLDGIGSWISGCAVLEHLPKSSLGLLESGLYEVCANIAEHGCGLDRHKTIDIWWIPLTGGWSWQGQEGLKVSDYAIGHFLIRDDGTPPAVDRWADPDIDSPRTREEGRGLGLAIIRRVLKRVEFHPNTEVGNVTLIEFEPLRDEARQEVTKCPNSMR